MEHEPVAPGGHRHANPQLGNVGNRGDIHKHAALVRLARLMAGRNPQQAVHYLDTHAFLVEAPLANPRWREEVEALQGRFPAYADYRALEEPLTARNLYLCSTGLAIACLPAAGLHLSESDAATRMLLQEQLAGRNVAAVRVLAEVARHADPPPPFPGPLLALVDPFTLTQTVWSDACRAVAALRAPEADGLLEVFTCHEDRASVDWPAPPEGWRGPLAALADPPYFVAVYAAGDEVAASAMAELAALGWDRQSDKSQDTGDK